AYQGRLAGDEWFDSVGYRGAFDPNLPREQQWDYGWTNYDPENYDPEFTTTVMNYSADWNMISVPRTVGSYEKVDLFPSSASQAFSYQAGYVQKNTLKNGEGYWLKFNSATTDTISGGTMYDLTFPVTVGWNMIGSISSSVDVASITSNPPGIVTGQFFSYSAGYNPATTIEPGKAYWVKVTSSGMFTLSTSPVAGAMNKIHIVPNGEMPPAPPTRSENNESLPAVYSLEQNYPNPFNPATTINFSLQQEGLVTLTIYTVLGQEVTVLANDQLFEQGKHQFRFDASNITSGLYYYRISVKDAVSGIVTYRHARSMILVK
ncbi:MAG: T9SS type A sorting domain-containing protein, partial [Bacteroidetes bacterium]